MSRKSWEDLSEGEPMKGLATAVTTRIESHGELVWGPGMPQEEAEVRDRDVAWRHGGEADAADVVAMHVAVGRWTEARAEAHLKMLRAQAERDREQVEEFDRGRTSRRDS